MQAQKSKKWEGPELLRFYTFIIYNLDFIQETVGDDIQGRRRRNPLKEEFYNKFLDYLDSEARDKGHLRSKVSKIFDHNGNTRSKRKDMTNEELKAKFRTGNILLDDIKHNKAHFTTSSNKTDVCKPSSKIEETIQNQIESIFKLSFKKHEPKSYPVEEYLKRKNWDEAVEAYWPTILQIKEIVFPIIQKSIDQNRYSNLSNVHERASIMEAIEELNDFISEGEMRLFFAQIQYWHKEQTEEGRSTHEKEVRELGETLLLGKRARPC